jgi:acetyl esterase/lipase
VTTVTEQTLVGPVQGAAARPADVPSPTGNLVLAGSSGRVDVVVAISPSSVIWANVGPGCDGADYPYRASWTWGGQALPFVPYDETWIPPADQQPVSYRPLYKASLRAYPEAAVAAAITIERVRGDVLLIAGGDDALWPSAAFAETFAARCRAAGRSVGLITHPDAGHRPIFPDEALPVPSTHVAHGGSLTADFALGRTAWPAMLASLNLR